MRLAVIDIGSNAVRLQINSLIFQNNEAGFKRLEYLRFPLRLGQDVFTQQIILPETEQKFIKLMEVFLGLIQLYEVEDYMVCATSAMRESKNGKEIVRKVQEKLGMEILVIKGKQEGEIIHKALYGFLSEAPCLHIDVGGGSTEVNFYVEKEKIATRSFKIGSVRRMQKGVQTQSWKKMEEWLEKLSKKYPKPITALGTGGNMNKVFDLAQQTDGIQVSLAEIYEVKKRLESFSAQEREFEMQLNHDRSDVILPATEIYITVLELAKIDHIGVPKVGLKDGMMNWLYEKQFKRKTDIIPIKWQSHSEY